MREDHTDSTPSFENGADIRERSANFASRVVSFSRKLCTAGGSARTLAPQLVNCATSVAAMLEEARGAESRRDFISKCSIGLKEAREALVRLKICVKTDIGPPDEACALAKEADELVAILMTIVRNARRNAGLAVSASKNGTNS